MAARMSEAEWEKIKSESGIVESNGEAHKETREVEPIATLPKPTRMVGQMQPAKGGKPAGSVTEWKSHEGYDAGGEPLEKSFSEKHPTLAKAVDIGKKTADVIGKKASVYIKDVEKSDKKLKEMERDRDEDEEEPEERSSKKKSSKKKSKGKMLDDEDFDFDDEDIDIKTLGKSTSKQKVLPGDYKTAYGGGIGKKGYEPVYTAGMGVGTYQPAYRPKIIGEAATTETPTEGMKLQKPHVNRFDIGQFQSVGFPNTLPMTARGALFRPAQQPQQVVPMVRQPYQPRAAMPMPRMGASLFTTPSIATPRAQMPRFNAPATIGLNLPRIGGSVMGGNLPRVAAPAVKRAQTPMGMPKMGGSLFTNVPSILPQKKTNTTNTNTAPAPIMMFGVPMLKKRK
jgi:hypothetical protein